MTAIAPLSVTGALDPRAAPDVEIVIPVHNEEAALERSIYRLHRYLSDRFPLTWAITIVDNASRDRTWGISCRLVNELPAVGALHLGEKGRGRALRAAWSASPARVVAYMDVDLSTDLDGLLPLVAPLLSGHSDVAIGSRLAPGASVVRGPRREVISRAYNLLLKATVHTAFSDAQCGFKAVRADVVRPLLELVEDDGWFFDTELLILAEHNGLRIHEVPVDWVDDPDSKVDVAQTARDDLRGVARVLRRLATGGGLLAEPLAADPDPGGGLIGQLVRFAGVGLVTTGLFATTFLALAAWAGPVAADLLALGAAGAVNLAANRRLTFARRGRAGRRRHYSAGLAVAALPLAVTVATLAILGAAGLHGTGADLIALTLVNAAVTAVRFPLLRHWVFR